MKTVLEMRGKIGAHILGPQLRWDNAPAENHLFPYGGMNMGIDGFEISDSARSNRLFSLSEKTLEKF